MYTTLLDKDGKVVDTNDPHRAIDQRYKSVVQGGEGAGLSKGDNVTIHFRMAAVTPNNADGDGTGVQEDTTYYMELPWQLVAAKQHRLRHRCVYRLRRALMVVGGLFHRNIHGSYADATERGVFACRVSFLGFAVDFRLGTHLLFSHTLRRYVA